MKEIKLPHSPNVKKTNFRGSPERNLNAMKYLRKKFKDCCVIIPEVNYKSFTHEDVSLRWIQTNKKSGHFSIPNGFWTLFTKCEDKRFIIFPFGFTCINNGGHANYIIYDKYTKSMERFESYGKSKRSCTNPIKLDIKIKKLFDENLGREFIKKYYKPLDFMTSKSFQSIQEDEKEYILGDPEGGFCAAFACWYAELRMSNPNKDRKRLVKIALERLQNNNISLTEYIRGYSTTI